MSESSPSPQDKSREAAAEEWAASLTIQSRPVDLLPAELVPVVREYFLELRGSGDDIVLMDRVRDSLQDFLSRASSMPEGGARTIARVFHGCQEVFFTASHVYARLRPRMGTMRIVRLHNESSRFEEVSRYHYLQVKDSYIQGEGEAEKAGLLLDFRPFFYNYPRVRETSAMGQGISVLNRNLAGKTYESPERFRDKLTGFLRSYRLEGENLLTNDHITSASILSEEIDAVDDFLADLPPETPYEDISHDLRIRGFEAGWGADAATIRQRLDTLSQVLDSADPERLAALLSKLPLIRRILMVSPHGWFAQNDVLGKPDTGGQVTYVLDQARALEKQMSERFAAAGVQLKPHIAILTRLIPNAEGTTCDQPREHVNGSDNCWIIRVPFQHADGSVHPDWVSRFHIWPFLEDYALESKTAVIAEFMGLPDLIVGHYSDGNLVAHRLAEMLSVTHCAAVHALEKTKYLLSDLYWGEMENEYHFSCQFTADIIAYNAADFIISSSFREIGGTDTEMGMFESYDAFSMPGLYRVTSGMDPRLARYNIVPPGASEEHFYPYTSSERRLDAVGAKLEELLFSEDPQEGCVGRLNNPALPPVFAMSRVDKVKNLPGLMEAYGRSEELRKHANLILMSSLTRAEQSRDQEEIEQIGRMYEIIEQYQLEGSLRWCGSRLDKVETGEIYRVIADHRGAFAQPAFMETFGLTVIEAMACGLPVVVTCFGGPAEIVVNGKSGEVANPNDFEAFANALLRTVSDQETWARYSQGGIARVHEAFNWSTHADTVLRMANVYAFWNVLDVMNRGALDQYISTLYHAVYRPRAAALAR
ncbi:MAG: sucrose synthase [Candidatus Hydrogenedens sp.]|nr:sucrose synthase [Candidatus Hydrogenedens sp.]